MSAGQYIKLKGAVGKNAPNHSEDVMTVQARLNHWIYRGLLPNIDFLAVDGKCGEKTKRAIGAFQFLYLGRKNPDCRVDPGGPTLLKMYESLINPQLTLEEFIQFLKNMAEEKFPAKQKVKNWTISPEEEEKIRRAWGDELVEWAKIPPYEGEAEGKEFAPPYFLRGKYGVVFGWKCGDARMKCAAQPRDRLQVLALLPSDRAYWEQRMKGNRVGVEMLVTSSATAIKDYREYIVRRGMCPPTAKARLEQVSKDVIYQMFLGMFQMMSPVGVPTAYANQSGAVASAVNAFLKWYSDPKKDTEKKPMWSYF